MSSSEFDLVKSYLSSNDQNARKLLRDIGSRITPIVVRAFQEYIRDFGGGPAKPMLKKFTEEGFAKGIIREDQFKSQMSEIEKMSDEPGVSLALMLDAHTKMKAAWDIIDEVRGIDLLVSLIYPEKDQIMRCSASLVFNGAEQLNYSAVKALEAIIPNIMRLEMNEPGNEIPFGILMCVLAKAEHTYAIHLINKIASQQRISLNELSEMYVNGGLDYLRKNGVL